MRVKMKKGFFKNIVTPKNPKPVYMGFTLESSDKVRQYILDTVKMFSENKILSDFKYSFSLDEEGFSSLYYKVKVVYPRWAMIGGIALILINIFSIWLLAFRFGGGLAISIPAYILVLVGLLLIFIDISFRSAWFFKILHKGNFIDMLRYRGYKRFFKNDVIKNKLAEVYDEIKCST